MEAATAASSASADGARIAPPAHDGARRVRPDTRAPGRAGATGAQVRPSRDAWASANPVGAFWEYWLDATQRSLLFLDVLRQRGNQYFAYAASGKPPLLGFKYELVIDGHDLDPPVNYVLLRILPPPPQTTNPTKRPIVVIDPRAGHGSGVGGSRLESQVGVALAAGHPVYFVAFRPDPEPSQVIWDILRAEAQFLRDVEARHPAAPRPFTIANCQAGWALAMLASLYRDLEGPIVLSGAPLAYWSGDDALSSMRYAGGATGGSWLTSLLGDLGNGTIDGAYLVSNFENLNPAHTLWGKPYNVYSKIDTEPPRYLGFEHWWNAFFDHRTEEMEFIVDNLFIGNKLVPGEITAPNGSPVNLKNIRAPIVAFASRGDNITPPPQAFNWIVDVYGSVDEIVKNRQVIIYVLHEDIGHLGIFVSSRVARKEHTAIINTLEFIDLLPPGLYELVVESRHAPDPERGALAEYTVRFEERSIDDLRKLSGPREGEAYFDTQRQVSESNAAFYRTFVRPWVRLFSSDQTAKFASSLLPITAQHTWFSDRNPWMAFVQALAEMTRANRRPASPDNPYTLIERELSREIANTLESLGTWHDNWLRLFFKAAYGPLGLGMVFPPTRSAAAPPPDVRSEERIQSVIKQLRAMVDQGGFVEATARMVLLLHRADGDIEPGYAGQETAELDPRVAGLDPGQMKQLFLYQHYVLVVAREEAIQALPRLLPTTKERRDALALATRVVLRGRRPNRAERAMLDQLTAVLGLPSGAPGDESGHE